MSKTDAIVAVVLTAVVILGLGGVVQAGERRLLFDLERSTIRFTLDATLHKVEGSFKFQRAELLLDENAGILRGTLAVDAHSASTGNAKRDKKMHEQVLESPEYPRITFRPHTIRGTLAESGESHVQVEGELGLHGTEHPFSVAVVVRVENGEVSATSGFSVPYVEWGLSDPSAFVLRVAKSVHVDVELVGRFEP